MAEAEVSASYSNTKEDTGLENLTIHSYWRVKSATHDLKMRSRIGCFSVKSSTLGDIKTH